MPESKNWKKELAEERIRRKITEDNSDCALWEYEIASKKYVLSSEFTTKSALTGDVGKDEIRRNVPDGRPREPLYVRRGNGDVRP